MQQLAHKFFGSIIRFWSSQKNMRLSGDTTNKSQNDVKEIANWILKIGDGLLDADENAEAKIQISE